MFDVKWRKQLFKYLIYAFHEVLVWNRVSADVKEMAVCVKENSTTREWKKNVKIIMGWGQEKIYL